MASVATTTVTGIDITSYLTGDAPRAIAFYRDTLGLVPTYVDAEGRGAEFTLADGTTFGVWNMPGGPTSGANVMFAVPEIHAAVALFRSRGAQLSDPMETPMCFMAFGLDPDRNAFTIHQHKH